MPDNVNHPSHYTWLKEKCGVEVIDITRHLDFDLGNALKYILRAGHKSESGMSSLDKTIEDLRKAIFYLEDKIKLLENEKYSNDSAYPKINWVCSQTESGCQTVYES